jgi:hypothetical protein
MNDVEGGCKVQALLGSLNHIKHESSTAQGKDRCKVNTGPFVAQIIEGNVKQLKNAKATSMKSFLFVAKQRRNSL